MLSLLEGPTAFGCVGLDCVEVALAYDQAELTSLAAATFVWTYLCGQIARRAFDAPQHRIGRE